MAIKIINEMLKILWKNIKEFSEIAIPAILVIGIPMGILYSILRLCIYLFGKEAMTYYALIILLGVFLLILVLKIKEWYETARDIAEAKEMHKNSKK